VNGAATLMDYCTGPSYASGGFIADSEFEGGTIVSGSQQQWITRNSQIDGWTNGVWNQVFSGVVGRACPVFPPRFVQRTIHHARNQSGNPRRALCVH